MNRLLLLFLSLSLCAVSCTTKTPADANNNSAIAELQTENDSLKGMLKQNQSMMNNRMITSLTFQDNNAEKTMNFYVDLFENSRIIKVQRWGKDSPVGEGKIMQATFDLNGNLFMCSDSPPVHDWDFTPAVSNYIECDSNEEHERLFSSLSENGRVTMPPNNYGFSQKFAWVIDQFGVSWQLNLQ